MRWRLALAIPVCLGAASGRSLSAQASWEFWPEAQLNFPAKSAFQGQVLSSWTAGQDSAYRQLQIGGDVLYSGIPHLQLSTGYSYYYTPAQAKNENRLIAELTGDVNLPAELKLLDRNRFEWRWVNGVYSTRYRNRLRLQRTVPLANDHWVQPYAEVEIYYTFSSASITRVLTQIGAVYRVAPWATIDGGYVHQNDQSASVNNVNAIELTLNFFL